MRQKIFNRWRAEITNSLSEQYKSPNIHDAICHGFLSWMELGSNTRDIPLLPHRDTEGMKVYDNQTNIGWQHFVRGRMVIDWGRLINDHLSKQQQYFQSKTLGIKAFINQ
jgi:hypothetical protein